MATGNTNKRADIPEIVREEHNPTASAKDAVLWGWDSSGAQYVKLKVDSDGKVQTSGGAGVWTRTGTDVTLATAGDTVVMNTNEKIEFRADTQYIASLGADDLTIAVAADLFLESRAIKIGTTGADTNIILTFFGTTATGFLQWVPASDYFQSNDDWLFSSSAKACFRATTNCIQSDGTGILDLKATTSIDLECPLIRIGAGAAGVDYNVTFIGETNSGSFKWMEDEDYFLFSDDILMSGTEKIYFSATTISAGLYSTWLDVYNALDETVIQVRTGLGGATYAGIGFRESATAGADMGFIGIERTDSPSSGDAIIHLRNNQSGTMTTGLKIGTSGNITIGAGVAGKDYTLTFDGETNDGVITWMEDEDYFSFSDDVVIASGERLSVNTTNQGSVVNILADVAGVAGLAINATAYMSGNNPLGTGNGALYILNTGNNGSAISIYSNNTSAQILPLVDFRADNTTFDTSVIRIQNDGTGEGLNIINTNASSAGAFVSSGAGNASAVLSIGTKSDGFVVGKRAEVQTTNATQTTVQSITLLDENTYHVEGYVVGVKSDGSQRASYHIAATVYRTGAGSATLQGTVTVIHSEESDTNWDATFTVSGNNVRLSVTGVAATTIEWVGYLTYTNMSN